MTEASPTGIPNTVQRHQGETSMNAKTTKAGKAYDGDLQMFCDGVREPNRASLNFLRWLAEQGKLEHEVSGPPSGDCVTEAT